MIFRVLQRTYCESCGIICDPNKINGMTVCERESKQYSSLIKTHSKEWVNACFKRNFYSLEDATQFWNDFDKNRFCHYCGTNSNIYYHMYNRIVLCYNHHRAFIKKRNKEGFDFAVSKFPKKYTLGENGVPKRVTAHAEEPMDLPTPSYSPLCEPLMRGSSTTTIPQSEMELDSEEPYLFELCAELANIPQFDQSEFKHLSAQFEPN